ncbi:MULTISPECIES: glycoside hydrolase family 13 protein [Terrabacteria group]|uniref:glycoside hydrolase family 13 protein n=1 Tax=Bacillati TaxID=1783272 RepID=UPI001C6ED819|nr:MULTISPECIES: glycoside hydrolase family 13 protein [Terrabacteria group]MBW9211991.1 glycoside hydrolase family 13 protein [Trueperella sp. zg.1013]
MEILHNTRQLEFRDPFGAIPVGSQLKLTLRVKDITVKKCELRTWVDGQGERLIPMEVDENGFHLLFPCPEKAIVWYCFQLTLEDNSILYYGAKQGYRGGIGQIYTHEPPSFQLTVYQPHPVPDWYKKAVVYQIFPDCFYRGKDWQELSNKALSKQRKGPGRYLVKDWDELPSYDKDEQGRIKNWSFYGGTLSGIQEKLPYLKELGIQVLYLNPIFEAASNHRYDTGDYRHVDEMLGGDKAFSSLIKEAKKYGISIILDGVFNHTGCDSLYFNRYGNYAEVGAYQSEKSKYRDWFQFKKDGTYGSWWGVDDLPAVHQDNEAYRQFICRNKDSIIRKWLNEGAKGWRLDVADELKEDFLVEIKKAVKEADDDGLLIGEVWEDASNKISYGELRHYLLGDELDGVMNYPWRDGIQNFLLNQISAYDLCEIITSIQENYPLEALQANLNMMSSHDSVRSMTRLGCATMNLSETEKGHYRLSYEQRQVAKSRIWLMLLLQMTLPGVPSIYYGDEAGLEGFEDPYNRASYPWGHEDQDVLTMYRNAISLRHCFDVFQDGCLSCFSVNEDVFGYYRENRKTKFVFLVNRSSYQTHSFEIEAKSLHGVDLLNGDSFICENNKLKGQLWSMQARLISFSNDE